MGDTLGIEDDEPLGTRLRIALGTADGTSDAKIVGWLEDIRLGDEV